MIITDGLQSLPFSVPTVGYKSTHTGNFIVNIHYTLSSSYLMGWCRFDNLLQTHINIHSPVFRINTAMSTNTSMHPYICTRPQVRALPPQKLLASNCPMRPTSLVLVSSSMGNRYVLLRCSSVVNYRLVTRVSFFPSSLFDFVISPPSTYTSLCWHSDVVAHEDYNVSCLSTRPCCVMAVS